ncbi:MAG: hypothetical protein IPL10_04495 [Bacteroidetes bacterium]|nr:hypothetical protein [Bacteroidota bacterium]
MQGSGDFDPGPTTYTLSANAQYAYSAYISKLDSNGNFVWAKNFITGETKGESITVDSLGNVYSVGKIFSTSDFDPGPSTYTLFGSSGSLYISKLTNSGNFVWAKATAANNFNQTFSLTLDLFNALYINGSYNGTVDFDPGTGIDSYTSVGVQDGFITKLDTAGNYKWTKTLKSSNTCYGASITTDANGNLYSAGYYYPDADFDPGVATYSLTATGFGEMFILKLDSIGSFLWAKTTQGGFSSFNTSHVFAYSLALDSQNSVYITGPFSGRVDFNTDAGSDSLDSYTGNSAYILKLNTNGNFQWAQTLGSHNTNAIAIDNNDNMIVAGEFVSSGDFDPTAGTYMLTSNGGDDVFISKTGSSVINVREFTKNTLLHIYPNPSHSNFTMVSKEKMSLTIIDNIGQIVQFID